MRAIIIAAAFFASATIFVEPVDAGRYGSGYDSSYQYDRTTVSRKPRHGYQGWVGVGRWRVFCSYHRYPVRKCNRKGRCRVVAWELRQFCN